MSKYTMRRGVQQSLSQRLFTEYLEELRIKKDKANNNQPKIVANKNK